MDEPIEDQAFLSGVTVIDIGDIRVSRGMTRRPASSCKHRRMAYDPSERRIWCKDCETDVDPHDAFRLLVEQANAYFDELNKRAARISEAEQFSLRSVAAREMDKAWRHRSMVPACPHCNNGLFPEDFKNGVAMLGKDYAKARLGKKR